MTTCKASTELPNQVSKNLNLHQKTGQEVCMYMWLKNKNKTAIRTKPPNLPSCCKIIRCEEFRHCKPDYFEWKSTQTILLCDV